MKILGIDYGRRKIGLATATTTLAEAYKVVRVESVPDAVEKVKKIAESEGVEKLVIGVSEGKMAKETKNFAKELKIRLKLPVEFQDETLSTQEAQNLSIEAGLTKKKRKRLEDAYSATLTLQNYLDNL
jgi:putative Holliday junction resolvase